MNLPQGTKRGPTKNAPAFPGVDDLWQRVFNTVPGLIMILDTEHHIIHANKTMAERLKCRPEDLRGLKCFEVVHRLAAPPPYCPHQQMLEDAQEHTIEAYEKNLKGTFDISVSPLYDDTGNLAGSIHIARDITEREKAVKKANEGFKQKIKTLTADLRKNNQQIRDRLHFEELMSEISATFINLSLDKIEIEIQNQIERLAKFLNIDRCILGIFSEKGDEPPYLYGWAKEGISPLPLVSPIKSWPWLLSQLRQGKVVKFSRLDELPEEAGVDRESWSREGAMSNLSIPLWGGKKVIGAISFAMMRTHRQWPLGLITRVRLLGDIFGNVLLRKQIDQELYQTLEEIKRLKERVEAERIVLEEEIKSEHAFEGIIGSSNALKYVLNRVEQVAPQATTVLILGETGTGKELVARAIHERSPRHHRPLIKVNCATLPANLIESELFGHEKNAYTGAGTRKIGRFEVADGSTLFLDEIGELPLDLQVKLLQVLQEGTFERLGSNRTIKVDVRIIAATNRDLESEMAEGRFRKDLWYRLNIFPITLPPLRKRREDIPLLVHHFVRHLSKRLGKKVHSIPKKTMEKLQRYEWPGNIRELENVIERAMVTTKGSTLQLMDSLESGREEAKDGSKTLAEVEKEHILTVLDKTRGKIEGKNGAAMLLDMNPSTLRGRMRKLGIKRPK